VGPGRDKDARLREVREPMLRTSLVLLQIHPRPLLQVQPWLHVITRLLRRRLRRRSNFSKLAWLVELKKMVILSQRERNLSSRSLGYPEMSDVDETSDVGDESGEDDSKKEAPMHLAGWEWLGRGW
jgi:hypothetical protein